MSIRINLLAELHAEEELRRRDPVKRAIFIGVFLVALSLVWFSSAWLETKMSQQAKIQLDDQIQSHTNDFGRVQLDLKKIADGQRRLVALQQLNTNRFLEGNLLNALQKIYIPNVQLTHLKLDQSYVIKDGATAGHPGSSTEKITLTLEAKDSSANPGDQVNRYKDLLAHQVYFSSKLQTNGVKLLMLAAPQIGQNGKPYVAFTLECRYLDKSR